ncbi:related to Histone-lysine N-methyltransferase, H3 lysine-9 specific dim-5 [Rhynchosporium agropyri]|uniref:Related to Histone-lysine N-methyltransferase, H3 lysine-9 specific dim-5 n=2 Tax=Rhynchosporium TaxID=38037 RepID=A0A1E1MVZ4_RHYSE|nr:related to Histone-lysine N-methyltransferase, H3 lysine-9 specific dim-5 [Rhynchosporium agropyri]CZT53234.1 related to Histone-lysine N-methyltransferase, H3 lysine-9 specific dim-5 [Rhynchosporium secalis]
MSGTITSLVEAPSKKELWITSGEILGYMVQRHHNHFAWHGRNNPNEAEDEKKCQYCQLKNFSTHQQYPVSLVFDEEERRTIPEDFTFIEQNILRDGVHLAEEMFLAGCECDDDHDCMTAACYCLQDVQNDDPGAKQNAYHIVGDRKGCLRGHMLSSRKPIYECHKRCGCSENCPNRVVGAGRKVNLQIFPTSDDRGWGVRTTEDIKRGQFVGCYVGEIITSTEARRRREAGSHLTHKDVYLFALDKFSDPDSQDPRLQGDPYEIDGEFFSGPTRFINHSCDPNLRIFAVVTDHANKPFHGLAFFALRDIDKDSELTFDYTDGVSDRKDDRGLDELTDEERANIVLTRCLCGADNCRGYLF